MPTYQYRARNKQGKIIIGTLEADNEAQVLARLGALGHLPIAVTPLKGKVSRKFSFSLRGRIGARTLVVFTRQLSTMVRAGIPLISALNALMEEAESEYFKQVLQRVKADIQEGNALSEAFSRHPQAFSRLYVNTVLAGETGDVVLNRLAALLEHEYEIHTNVQAALRYPIIVVVGIFTAFFVLVTMIVPKFTHVYQSAKVDLPLPTQVLIAIDYGIRHWWYYIIPAILVLALALRKYIHTERGKYQWDFLKLKLPIFGPLFIKIIASRFSQMLATLDRSGLPILKTLDIASVTLGNAVVGKEIDTLRKSVLEGRGMAEPIMESKFFPPLVSHMVAIGEQSGSLDEMLDALQQHYDVEINATIRNLTTLIEPILTVGLGLIILFIALGIFLPIWDLSQAVRAR